MDWLRRNWPDLLIGVALIIVIAMIIVTLLSGGSLASLVRRDAPQPLATTAGTEGTNGDAAGTTASSTPAATPANTAANTTSNTTVNTTTDGMGAAGAADGYDVFVPGVPGRAGDAEGGQAADTTGTSADTSVSTGDQASDGGAGSEIDAPLPSASRTGGFRVAAGATSSRDGARTSAETLRDNGYEVTVEQANDLYLLWVGPYASDAGAERVAGRLRTDGLVPDAIVYSYDGERDDAEAAADIAATSTPNGAEGAGTTLASNNGADGARASETPTDNASVGNTDTGTARTGNTSATTAGNAAADNEVAEDLAAGAGSEQYLQVGAFASDESAAPRRAQLEQLGLSVTSSESDNGLLRLFVGPYREGQLAQVQTRLSAQGIESFPVSQ